jgi:DNA-binding NarL/FixJ family response regulator
MCPTAIGDARRSALGLSRPRQNSASGNGDVAPSQRTHPDVLPTGSLTPTSKIGVCISAQNQLVREALRRVLSKIEQVRVVAGPFGTPAGASESSKEPTQVAVLFSRDRLQADLDQIEAIRGRSPETKILLVGSAKEDAEFLQYVRAGISGYLWQEATADDIAQGILNVHEGKAVCPGELCAALFRFFEDAEPRLPFGSPTQRLGLTRREQQIVPLIAKGFTNKEIANHFCLSEQTVKNHLYRMKHKIGAEDRLSIVQKFRHCGLML